jgi:hypothetical protein
MNDELRYHDPHKGQIITKEAAHRAADEIERLRHDLSATLQRLHFYNPRDAEEIAQRLDLAKPEQPKPLTHKFEPHPKHPWFCKRCGYPDYVVLNHGSKDTKDE